MYRVLLVDDEPWSIEVVKALGKWEELQLTISGEVTDGDAALDFLSQEHVDVVITDMRMPGLDGARLLEAMSSRFPHVKIIVVSGYDDFSYLRGAIRSKAVEYLLKPIDPAELNRCLKLCIEQLQEDSLLASHTLKVFTDAASRERYQGYRFRLSEALLELNAPLVLRTLDQLGIFLTETLGELPNRAALATLAKDLLFLSSVLTAQPAEQAALPDLRSASDLIAHVSSAYSEHMEASRSQMGREQLNIDDVVDYLDLHFAKDLSLEAVARQFLVSKEHLSRAFKTHTGENFTHYLLKKRMEKAKELILSTDFPIKEIGESVGYNDMSYFHRVFKKYHGTTPGALRDLRHQ